MGFISQQQSSSSSSISESRCRTHKIFLLCNYILLGAASSCIFLTLSLRLFPSLPGLSLILLHTFTLATAISGCTATFNDNRCYGAHMVATVLTAIFQGSVSVLIFTRTGDFLAYLRSYVLEEDGSIILKLAGGLCALIFCLEWVVLVLAFFLKYYAYLEGEEVNAYAARTGKGQQEEELKDWPSYPVHV